jgi:hypothetical protein
MEYYSIAKRLYEQQTFHTIQIVIHLVSVTKTNLEPFKTQPIALEY